MSPWRWPSSITRRATCAQAVGVDLQRRHAPASHLGDEFRNLFRFRQRPRGVLMDGWSVANERAGHEDARREVGVRVSVTANQLLGRDHIAGLPDGDYAVGQEVGQDFIAGHAGGVQDGHDMRVGVDQARDGVLASPVQDCGALGNWDAAGLSQRLDAIAPHHDHLPGPHLARLAVEDRHVANDQRVRRGRDTHPERPAQQQLDCPHNVSLVFFPGAARSKIRRRHPQPSHR